MYSYASKQTINVCRYRRKLLSSCLLAHKYSLRSSVLAGQVMTNHQVILLESELSIQGIHLRFCIGCPLMTSHVKLVSVDFRNQVFQAKCRAYYDYFT